MNTTETVAPLSLLPSITRTRTRVTGCCAHIQRERGRLDRVERLMAFGTGPWYRRQALRRAGLTPDMRVLAVGTGTGLTAIQAARITGGGANVTGVDPSVGMLANARLPAGMRVIEGRAEALPAADGAFDFVSMGYAIASRCRSCAPCSASSIACAARSRDVCWRSRGPTASRRHAGCVLLRYLVPLVARWVGRSRDTPEVMRYFGIDRSVRPPQQVIEQIAPGGIHDRQRHVVLGIFSEYVAIK